MPRYLPKSIVCFRGLWNRRTVINDCLAGLTVGDYRVAVGDGFRHCLDPRKCCQQTGISPPALGLFTAVVAGFLISALGGSRVQIGGPTGAFVIIVYGVVARHGYEGLAVATILAGFMIMGFGFLRLGNIIKFIPYPVTTVLPPALHC